MSAPEQRSDSLELLAAAARLEDSAARRDAAVTILEGLVHEGADAWEVRRHQAEAKRLGLLTMGDSGALLASARRRQRSARAALAPVESPAEGAEVDMLPEGATVAPGASGAAWRPPSGDDPGEVYLGRTAKHGKVWDAKLGWAPGVPRRFSALNDAGGVAEWYFEIIAAGGTVRASAAELIAGDPWRTLAVPGAGTKRMREALADVVLAAAQDADTLPALSRTGWHRDAEGMFYVFADGRAYPARDVFLVGNSHKREALAAAAAPVERASAAELAQALADIAEHGGVLALLVLGRGVRSYGQSLRKVRGGLPLVGLPNSGKSGLAWHARTLAVARPGDPGAWPPVPTATFGDTITTVEAAVNFEADMPSLIDDAPLHEKSSRAERDTITAILERVFRALANDTPTRDRMDREMNARPSMWVRSPAMATLQAEYMQDSLKRRVFAVPVNRGDIDIAWYRRNSHKLVRPLRTIGDHIVVPFLAGMGWEGAGAYLLGRDNEARDLIGDELSRRLPDWETSGEGIAGVVDIAAADVAGLLVLGEALAAAGLERFGPAELAAGVLGRVTDALAAQAGDMRDGSEAASPAEALADILTAALLRRAAHVRDSDGFAAPVIPGMTAQEQGLRPLAGREGEYDASGVPFYWLPELAALGVPSRGLHALVAAAADPRLPARAATTLPLWLLKQGLALPGGQEHSPVIHQEWIGGGNVRLVLLSKDVFYKYDSAQPDRPDRPDRPQVDSDDSNAARAEGASQPDRPQVRGTIEALEAPSGQRSSYAPEQAPSGSIGFEGAHPLELAPESAGHAAAAPSGASLPPGAGPRCAVCRRLLDPALVRLGMSTHPTCDQGPVLSAAELAARGFPASLAEPEAEAAPSSPPSSSAAARPRAALRVAERAPAPRFPFLVLGGDGRAYGPDGEVCEVPPGRLEGAGSLGELGGLGLELEVGRRIGRGVLWVPGPAREALRLPASLGELGPLESVPHQFAEATDTSRWDISPAGLAKWVNVYRQPRTLHEGIDIAFAEWLPAVRGDGPQLGELSPPELAAALTHIWRATMQESGSASGSVHYHRSPPATMRRLLEASARRSRKGRPEVRAMPLPLTPEGRKAGLVVRPPGGHVGPVAEVPAGWALAQIDVRSCYLSAPIGTEFATGEYEHLRPGKLSSAPGLHLVQAPAEAARIHPALTPWFPRPGRRQAEVSAWLDTVAVRLLADEGVPLEVLESYTSTERQRIFDSPARRLGEARARLKADGSRPAAAAAAVVTAMYQHTLGGWLASDAWDRSGDWLAAPDWWLTIKSQAEVRKQRNLLPALQAGAGLVVLAHSAIDTVYVAAPSAEVLEGLPGAGGRPLIREGRGGFALEALAEVSEGLSATLARADGKARLGAIKQALAAGEAETDRK